MPTYLDRIYKIDDFISRNWKTPEQRVNQAIEIEDLTYLCCYYENLSDLFDFCHGGGCPTIDFSTE
jgi:hypothetical protein